ncbi:MAG TPA: sugar ABC transporter substrate-binding protein, partial [Candidatus Atribacteria bacterium]|nr:sugar ABC transporter substrate-binding protein [Candidatus Atribacteria bacterium]
MYKSFVAVLLLVVFLGSVAFAAEFMGFDPLNFKGEMLSEETLKAMVQEAMKVTPPKNGKNYVFAFANLQRDITFCMAVEEGIKKNCEAAGIELVIADNRLSGPTALANAESFITRNVDFVIEFQT